MRNNKEAKMPDDVTREEMMDEFELAFNNAIARAKIGYAWRVPALERAANAIRTLIERSDDATGVIEATGACSTHSVTIHRVRMTVEDTWNHNWGESRTVDGETELMAERLREMGWEITDTTQDAPPEGEVDHNEVKDA